MTNNFSVVSSLFFIVQRRLFYSGYVITYPTTISALTDIRSLHCTYKLALLPPSKYTKTLLYYHLGMMNNCGPTKCPCSQQGQNLRKL